METIERVIDAANSDVDIWTVVGARKYDGVGAEVECGGDLCE